MDAPLAAFNQFFAPLAAQIEGSLAQLSGAEAALAGAATVVLGGMLRARLKKPALPGAIKLPAAAGAETVGARGICARLVDLWRRCVDMFDYLSTRREWRYQQPWVLLLGEQGAGKTSLLQSVAASMRQIPPARAAELQATRTDWFFFRKGALIDPQGKYAAADPGSSEGAQWRQTLAELNALRPERPLDGLVLCISARSLLQADATGRETLAMNLQRQLGELQESMEFMLPLSVVVTQCDAIDGFAAFWGNQAQKRRLELFGYAAPPQTQAAAPAEWVSAAFETIDERLRSLQVETAASRDSIADCDAFFLFPGRFRRLCDPLGIFLETALRSSAWQAGYLFRGLFFAGSPSADGELHEGARQDVAFADSLLAMRVLAEPGLARPTRNGIFSRNTLIRGLQYASLGLAAGLFGMLYFSSLRVSAQVHVLISAMDQLRDSTPDAVRHGDCLGAESVYPLLSEVAAINQNTRYWAIPASWLDTRIVHRNDAGIETGTIGTVLMPTLACRLENKARTLASASYALPDADDGSAFATLRQALADKLAAVRELEENLARFERLANNGADLERAELLSTLTALAQYAFDAPLPPDVQHEHGALSAGFGNVPPALKPVLPPRLHQDLAFEIRRLAEATRISLHQQVGLGAVLLGRLDRAEAPVLDNTRRFADWLSWTDTSWLLSTPAVNPCAELHTATKTEIEALVDRYAYPKALWRDVEQFDTEHCYRPEMQALAGLRQAPYGLLFVPRAPAGLTMAPSIRRDLAGLPALVKLGFMRLDQPQRFVCQPAGEGFRSAEVAEAAGYVKEYQDFAAQMKVRPTAEGGRQPLFDRLARQALANALDDAMQRAQIAVSATPAQQVSIETVRQGDQQLSTISQRLGGGLDALLGVLRAYADYGNPATTPVLRQCARDFAADSLSRVSALAASSRLYSPPPAVGDDQLFDLGSLPVQKEYLARQVARAQVLAAYATPFMNLLQGTPSVSDTQRDAASGADFWKNSIDELNRYTQGKEPTGQVANLDDYFMRTLAGLTYANCNQQLAKYQSPELGNDLFSARRRALEPMVQLRCLDRRVAQAMENYGALAQRFNRDLAGRYPFAGPDAADANPAVLRQFLLDYASQRQTLGEAMALLNGEGASAARQFVAALDATASFFSSNLAAGDASGGEPIRLQATFNAAGPAAAGSEQIVAWQLNSGGRSAGQPNRPAALDWRTGETFTLELTWANRSAWKPQADPTQADLRIAGATATFGGADSWALLRLIERHAKTATAGGDALLLGFAVPQLRDGGAGKADTGRANVYLGLTLLGTDPKTHADIRLHLPAQFPQRAPVLD